MEFIYILTFLLAFMSSVLSGVAGGGGGFIMAPYWLAIGLTPSQGATTGAYMAIGMGASSSYAFRHYGYLADDKPLIIAVLAITFFASIVGPFFLHEIPINSFKLALACLTLFSIPFLFVKPKIRKLSMRNTVAGYALITIVLLLSSFITSSAFSIIVSIILIQLFGTTTLQSIALRRLISIVQSCVIFIILVALGNLIWQQAIAGLIGSLLGSYIGTRFAIKRGEDFAKYALVIGALVGTVAMFITK